MCVCGGGGLFFVFNIWQTRNNINPVLAATTLRDTSMMLAGLYAKPDTFDL